MRKSIWIFVIVIMAVGLLACNGQQGGVTEETSDVSETIIDEENSVTPEDDEESNISSEQKEENMPQSEQDSVEDYIPDMTLEEALAVLEEPETRESLYFKEEVGMALYNARTPQENAMDFTGEWSRTNVPTYHCAEVTISNQDENGFDVNGTFFWYSHTGDIINERAYFVTEDLAIYEIHDEWVYELYEGEYGDLYKEYWKPYEYIAFQRVGDELLIYATGAGGQLGYFSANCWASGEFVQGEPAYTNANILAETYTESQLEQIRSLVGEELYEKVFVTTTEHGSVTVEECVLEDGTFGKEYHSYIMGVADYHFYRIYIFENGDIYGEIGPDDLFFTNVSGVTEVPKYINVEGTYAGFQEYLQMKAPNMQAGDVVSMSTSFYYYFAIGDAVDNHNGEAVESVYVLKHPVGKLFLLICYDSMSHDFVTKVYDITGNEPVQCSMLSLTEVTGDAVSIDRITLCHTLNILGTYWCDIDYALDENGQLIALSNKYAFEPPESEYWDMILKKELPVIMNGTNTTIASGEKIEIIGTDRECEIYFRVINTGETGTILYETEVDQYGVETYMINGVSEYDYFEWLPYTG